MILNPDLMEESMLREKYRVESSNLMVGPLLPNGGTKSISFIERQIAIVVAAKSMTVPYGAEILVSHIQTGEVVFRKSASDQCCESFD